VALLQHFVPDYRVGLFREMVARGRMNITLFHSTAWYRNTSKPGTNREVCPGAVSVRSYEWRIGPLNIVLQPGALWNVIRGQFDCVMCQSGRAYLITVFILLWCKLKRIPFLWWTGSWEPPFPSPFLARVLYGYQRLLWRIGDGAVVYNREARRKLIANGMRQECIFVAQNTRDERPVLAAWEQWQTKAAALRASLAIGSADHVVLFVGALVDPKRVDLLIEAFHMKASAHPDWHLVIVGDGVAHSSLETQCLKDDVPRVHFVGRVIDEVYAYFALCDVFVLPALGGLALNDAMICRKPVISGAADDTEKDLIVDGQTGYLLCSTRDEAISLEIAERLEDLLAVPEKARAMGEAAFLHYQRTATLENMIATFERAAAFFASWRLQ